ncbi:tyrosine-type recombinase/integrase [Thalassobius sp. MITS945101]|uniref:tyrosine-type recombinase/integrase n=1 Tax=Thalassobius sp. MITS945101 TaxID=3096994 RepID=UPI00399A0136
MAKVRQDQIRAMMHGFFQNLANEFTERLNDTGLTVENLKNLAEERRDCEAALNGDSFMIDTRWDHWWRDRLQAGLALTDDDWADNNAALKTEFLKARRDQITESLNEAEALKSYTFSKPLTTEAAAPIPHHPVALTDEGHGEPLGPAVMAYMSEYARGKPGKTVRQIQAYLNILIEYFGPERRLGTISKKDAADARSTLMQIPASRNTKPALRALPLTEVVKVDGHKRMAPKTINSHIDAYRRFFEWAERMGQSPHVLFEDMKLKEGKKDVQKRKSFPTHALVLMYRELTENTSELVRSESHRWVALIGMFSGARLNEICQLEVCDIKNDGGIWYFDLTDEGDNAKKLKAEASNRKVPVHSKLIELGFLDFVETRRNHTRLFHDYSYHQDHGYGRSFGRWFNENTFLPKLKLKEPGVVFHCFRHTMATRLVRENVPEPIVKSVIGHAQEGTTQRVYVSEGYSLVQLKQALEKFDHTKEYTVAGNHNT